MEAPHAPAEIAAHHRPHERAWLGYVCVWTAVAVWSLNAAAMKVTLEAADLSAFRLAELRATGSALLLVGALAVARAASLRISLREMAFVALFGVVGLALGQLFYILSIERLDIGIALVVIYTSPLMVALWSRFVAHEPVRRRLWLAIALSLVGLSLVVDVWSGVTLGTAGLAACLITAACFAAYVLMGDEGRRRGRDAYSLVAWGFAFAAIFWAAVQPWWTFPGDVLAADVSLLGRLADVQAPVWLLVLYVIVFGTLVPFGLIVKALDYIAPTRVAIIAMLEPVGGAVVAFAWLGEELTALELTGGALVLAGVAIAQTARSAST
jgi:drug/metabolite transporter (DMT)-like permease